MHRWWYLDLVIQLANVLHPTYLYTWNLFYITILKIIVYGQNGCLTTILFLRVVLLIIVQSMNGMLLCVVITQLFIFLKCNSTTKKQKLNFDCLWFIPSNTIAYLSVVHSSNDSNLIFLFCSWIVALKKMNDCVITTRIHSSIAT